MSRRAVTAVEVEKRKETIKALLTQLNYVADGRTISDDHMFWRGPKQGVKDRTIYYSFDVSYLNSLPNDHPLLNYFHFKNSSGHRIAYQMDKKSMDKIEKYLQKFWGERGWKIQKLDSFSAQDVEKKNIVVLCEALPSRIDNAIQNFRTKKYTSLPPRTNMYIREHQDGSIRTELKIMNFPRHFFENGDELTVTQEHFLEHEGKHAFASCKHSHPEDSAGSTMKPPFDERLTSASTSMSYKSKEFSECLKNPYTLPPDRKYLATLTKLSEQVPNIPPATFLEIEDACMNAYRQVRNKLFDDLVLKVMYKHHLLGTVPPAQELARMPFVPAHFINPVSRELDMAQIASEARKNGIDTSYLPSAASLSGPVSKSAAIAGNVGNDQSYAAAVGTGALGAFALAYLAKKLCGRGNRHERNEVKQR